MRHRHPHVYMLASRRNGTLYVGVTSALSGRISTHRQELLPGFTKKYGVHILVKVEDFATMEEAIAREKQLKGWSRARKIALIEQANPEWKDLWFDLTGETT